MRIEELEHRVDSRFGRSHFLRPPWADEKSIRSHCTSCGDCLRACPEAILVAGPAGTPVVNFSSGECTFCGACADICAEQVFKPTSDTPWDYVAHISSNCFLKRGVECRSCTDVCEPRAVRFDLRQRPVGGINLDTEACTGCGACISICPADAISVGPAIHPEVRA